VQSLGSYLERSDGDTILRDVEDFGRRQPWAVIAGGVVLGFAASRFLKASSSRRYEQPRTTTSGLTNGAPTTRTGLYPGDAVGTTAPPTPPIGAPPTPPIGAPPTSPTGGLAAPSADYRTPGTFADDR
jgi:hypothetical protein